MLTSATLYPEPIIPESVASLVRVSREEINPSHKTNAKPVQWLNMNGEVLGVFPSGLETQKALGVTQFDISQCCRGKVESVGGFKFRFFNEELRPEFPYLRAATKAPPASANGPAGAGVGADSQGGDDGLSVPTTRASNRAGGQPTASYLPPSMKFAANLHLNPPNLKVRRFRKVIVKTAGNLIFQKWVSDQDPNAELQTFHPKHSMEVKGRKRKSRGNETGNRAVSEVEVVGDVDE